MNNPSQPGDRNRKWGTWVQGFFPACSDPSCRRRRWKSPWGTPGFHLHGAWYCTPECYELALAAHYRRMRQFSAKPDRAAHRIPLGLLLLARGWLSNAQLRAALRAQQAAGKRRVGEWLVEMGATTEEQVTAALAQQCGCPVFPLDACAELRWAGMIPIPIQESFRIMPMYYVPATRFLLIAFCDGVDHSILYSIEQALECRAEPCLLPCSVMQRLLEHVRQQGRSDEIVFERVSDPAELARITRSYVVKLNADDVRIIGCGEQVWVRLQCARDAMNLVFEGAVSASSNRVEGWAEMPLPLDTKALMVACR